MNISSALSGFLSFEQQMFGDSSPIAHYDPYLIRYGEYQFALEALNIHPNDRVIDVGCETNIFMLYLASLGAVIHGVDLDQGVWAPLWNKIRLVEQTVQRHLAVTFNAEDATNLTAAPGSFDKAIAISSIEHMFSTQGHGDQLAVGSIARVLKPGGIAVITVPMSNGGPFHETQRGDAQFAGPYRLYTPEILAERLLSQPQFETVSVQYLAQTTPDKRFPNVHFFHFWMNTLTAEERLKWAWANPILAAVFNPIISQEEGHARPDTMNTALIHLKKR
jgi:SAM-dependent methyltransferase